MHLLEVKQLGVQFQTPDGVVSAVNGINFTLNRGETLGIVGESGSGKSQSMLAMMGLLAINGNATGQVLYKGQDLISLPTADLNRIRGNRVAMIFQDPMTSLNPYLTVERQMTEVLEFHKGMSRKDARIKAIQSLDAVKMPEAARRIAMYPHEFSGGMRQRVMIAMSLLCEPDVLIADEPTTALDVTIQAQILDLLRSLQKDRGMALVLITHNMGVVSEMAQRVAVMYAGQIMEQRGSDTLFTAPQHPYTEALMAALPERNDGHSRLATIPGMVPGLYDRPKGCLFSPRCSYANDGLCQTRPALRDWQNGAVRCHFPMGDPNRNTLAPKHAEVAA
jgi:oligopeptide/dipeptide ABC transporter ATP-binding protein